MNDRIDIAARWQRFFLLMITCACLGAGFQVMGLRANLTGSTFVADRTLSEGTAGLMTKAAVGRDGSLRFDARGIAIDGPSSLEQMQRLRRVPTQAEQHCIDRWDPRALSSNPHLGDLPSVGRENVLVSVRSPSEVRYGRDGVACVIVARYLTNQRQDIAYEAGRTRYAEPVWLRRQGWSLRTDGSMSSASGDLDTVGWFEPNASLSSDGRLLGSTR